MYTIDMLHERGKNSFRKICKEILYKNYLRLENYILVQIQHSQENFPEVTTPLTLLSPSKFNLSLIAYIIMGNYMAKTYNLFVYNLDLSTIPI